MKKGGRGRYVLIWGVAATAALASLIGWDWWSSLPDTVESHYVGGQRCLDCHAAQAAKWRNSDHDRAMDLATPETVLGNFQDQRLEHFGLVSRMFRRDQTYFVETEGPDGKLAEFPIKYVFGVRPLQQYLVEFDRPPGMPAHENARLQVLPLCWNTLEQKWFYLSPPDVREKLAPDDPLHWTQAAQNWNHMLARCHSTNLHKGFDPDQRVFHSTFTDIDVNCEACHGPGSVHLQLAQAKSLFWDRKRGYGLASLRSPSQEIETCAPCHSRRTELVANPVPGEKFLDNYSHELLRRNVYYPDGQILEEDYEYGSFVQSKMYHKGIRCSDCHDPHSAQLKSTGNALCTSCHAHSPGKYDTAAHHHHQPDSAGAQCVACHMPETPYMQVDLRRDHSLRIPRPDLSVQWGTPNACAACHLQKEGVSPDKLAGLNYYADWLQRAREGDGEIQAALERTNRRNAEQVRAWFPESAQREHFAGVLARAEKLEPDVVPELAQLVRSRRWPGIVRATAVESLLRLDLPSPQRTAAFQGALQDEDPQVRLAAIPYAESAERKELLQLMRPLLDDSTRAVRIAAARALYRIPDRELSQVLDPHQLAQWKDAIRDYEAGLRANQDQAGAWIGLAWLAERRGDLAQAAQAYQQGSRVQPWATGPRSNLANLLEDWQATVLRGLQGKLAQLPPDEAKTYAAGALGIVQRWGSVEQLRRDELELLRRDARYVPLDDSIQYRLGLAWYLQGNEEEAEKALRRATELQPNEPTYWLMLALLEEKRERLDEARAAADQLLRLRPENPEYRALREKLGAMAHQ